eukprot:scaffold638256_cov38-Prasinocladus_malaysianus.AAC.1
MSSRTWSRLNVCELFSRVYSGHFLRPVSGQVRICGGYLPEMLIHPGVQDKSLRIGEALQSELVKR